MRCRSLDTDTWLPALAPGISSVQFLPMPLDSAVFRSSQLQSMQATAIPFASRVRLVVVSLGLAACSAGSPAGSAVGTAPAPVAPVPTAAMGDEAAIARARADSSAHPWVEADARFMSSMIGHHAQAILISRWAPENTDSRTIHTLSSRIINAQKDEIALMQNWLRDRLQPVPDAEAMIASMEHAGHGMASHGAHSDHAGMPGMLTDEELKRLYEARGTEFDRIFLTSMIKHHRGAVTMVEDLFSSHGAGQDETSFRLATDINVDQITEINRMEQLLITLFTEGSLP